MYSISVCFYGMRGGTLCALHRTFLQRFVRTRGCATSPSGYGEADFVRMRKEKMFYVDKTKYAVRLLSEHRALLLRPPRMGKSLFINTVECLFDMRFKEQYDNIFRGL